MARNRQWRLASFPEGMPSEANWTLSDGAVPKPGPEEILARAIYLDVGALHAGPDQPAEETMPQA